MDTYLPNIILKKIFEYRIDLECSLTHYYQLIKTFILISKRIQLEVLPKVRYSYRFTIDCSQPKEINLLKNLNKLTGIGDLQYSMELPLTEITSFVNSDIGDQIYKRITQLDMRIGDRHNMRPEILDKFVNLHRSCFTLSLRPKDMSVIHQAPYDRFKVNEVELLVPTLQIDDSLFHLLFNSNSISLIFMYGMDISIPKSIQLSSGFSGNINLTELRLSNVKMKSNDTALLISKSVSLQKLVLNNIRFLDEQPTPILDAVIQLQNLQRFVFISGKIQLKDTVYLLNNLKCQDVMVNIDTLQCEQNENLLATINNPFIKNFCFSKIVTLFNHPQRDFNFITIWRQLSALETIEIVPNTDHQWASIVYKLTNLKSIKIIEDFYPDSTQLFISDLVSANLPKLTSISIENSQYHNVELKSISLSHNHFINSITIGYISFQEILKILELEVTRQTLMLFSVSYVITVGTESLSELIPFIVKNKVLHTINIKRRMGTKEKLFNVYNSILYILKNNSNIRNISFPNKGKLSEDTHNEYKLLLQSDRILNLWHIGLSFFNRPDLTSILIQSSISSNTPQ
ncbi:hypothetical protein DLAC_11759 [Tieghemostelium lacteum]|uniref:Uncharacterized protein n=1 Tax=Tieghemostelium lacteum TaxID=361077 RepID=A0A151Z970_TIELA|nr:hypothetical protein DLAC_11759 [Tieghemostelium lacteum]|eukprot:KYQ90495.1 hypothetical protein DLAC_11759 [Tieghemostelium lacteum]